MDDETLALLVGGDLDEVARQGVNGHLVACASCRAVLATYGRRFCETPEGSSAGTELRAGDRLGRFLIHERVGAGGMGVVYRAHDPELDRFVALKLLRHDVGTSITDLEARHRREAQAMARLSHPNVVAVYDVGVDHGRVFIASEFIDGVALQRWLDSEERAWPDIVDCFIEAGQGLCAIHEAGLVHRDFKPANVMIGEGGRICVVDFGLVSSEPRSRIETTGGHPTVSEFGQAAMTKSGTILGTPAFLAPECLEGQPATPAADQFSFCVSLYLAVHGIPPFAGASLEQRQAQISEGRLDSGPQRVPAWLDRVLRRGLAFRPEDRYPSLALLLEQLRSGRRRTRRTIVGGSLAVALSLAAGLGYAVAKVPSPRVHDLCTAEHALAGVWDSARSERMDRLARATAPSYVGEAWKFARAHFDAYTADFESSRARACAASRREQPVDAWLDCLARKRVELGLTLDLLEEDHELFARSPELAAALDSLGVCEQASPRDASRREPVELLARLGRAEQLVVAGRYEQARDIALTTAKQAREASEPEVEVEAQAHVIRARALAELGQFDAAIQALDEAITVALVHDTRPALEAWIALVELEGVLAARPKQGERWAARAQALLAARPPQPRLEARLATNLGMVYASTHELQRSLAFHGQALEQLSDDPRLDVDRIELLNNLAGAIARTGDLDGAEQRYLQALELAERTLGVGHPHTGIVWGNLAAVRGGQRRWPEAEDAARRAVVIKKSALGPEHPSVGASLASLAGIVTLRDQPEQAIALLEEALPILERARGEEHPSLLTPLFHLSQAYMASERLEDASLVLERAEANARNNHGTEHPSYAELLYFRGRLFARMQRGEEALADLRQALELQVAQLGPEHHQTRNTQIMLAQVELQLGYAPEARARLEPIVPAEGELLSDVLAHAAFALARALPSTEHARARQLAERARRALAARGIEPTTITEIDAFLELSPQGGSREPRIRPTLRSSSL